MAGNLNDFAIGLATSYRAALLAAREEVRTRGGPDLQGAFDTACCAAIEGQIASALPCSGFSDNYIEGLQAAIDDLKKSPLGVEASKG